MALQALHAPARCVGVRGCLGCGRAGGVEGPGLGPEGGGPTKHAELLYRLCGQEGEWVRGSKRGVAGEGRRGKGQGGGRRGTGG